MPCFSLCIYMQLGYRQKRSAGFRLNRNERRHIRYCGRKNRSHAGLTSLWCRKNPVGFISARSYTRWRNDGHAQVIWNGIVRHCSYCYTDVIGIISVILIISYCENHIDHQVVKVNELRCRHSRRRRKQQSLTNLETIRISRNFQQDGASWWTFTVVVVVEFHILTFRRTMGRWQNKWQWHDSTVLRWHSFSLQPFINLK